MRFILFVMSLSLCAQSGAIDVWLKAEPMSRLEKVVVLLKNKSGAIFDYQIPNEQGMCLFGGLEDGSYDLFVSGPEIDPKYLEDIPVKGSLIKCELGVGKLQLDSDGSGFINPEIHDKYRPPDQPYCGGGFVAPPIWTNRFRPDWTGPIVSYRALMDLNVDGRVESVTILCDEPMSEPVKLILSAYIMQWRFHPAKLGGHPVRYRHMEYLKTAIPEL